jgi:multidrug efflux pump subunit AcrA (membrane-fusion protein)
VNELDIAKMITGFPVRITIDALPDSVFNGRIDAIGTASEEGSHFYPVDIVIDQTHSKSIKAGMFARCLILTQTKQNAIVVPLQAIMQTSGGKTEVFVSEDTVARRVSIITGVRNQSRCEILSGLSGHERIVLCGKESLQDGSAIVERIAGK